MLPPPGQEAEPGENQRFYHPELDGLRFLAFLLVFIHHLFAGSSLTAEPGSLRDLALALWECGALGVDLFFCLSGFLITRLLLLEEERTGSIDVGRFYLRRLLRIWPLYYAFLGLIVFLGSLGWETRLGAELWPYLLLVGNWASAFNGFPHNSALVLWSVCLEEQFYLFWPLAVRRLRARWVAAGAVAMILTSIFCRILVAIAANEHPATWTLTLTRLDSLAAGILVAALLGGRIPVLSAGRRFLLVAAAAAAWIVVAARWPHTAAPTLGAATASYPAIAAGAALMLIAALAPRGGTPGWLAWRPLVFLGKISYGLYVFHLLAIRLAERFFPLLEPQSPSLGLLALALTIAAAALSYFTLERPFLQLKDRFALIRSRPV